MKGEMVFGPGNRPKRRIHEPERDSRGRVNRAGFSGGRMTGGGINLSQPGEAPYGCSTHSRKGWEYKQ